MRAPAGAVGSIEQLTGILFNSICHEIVYFLLRIKEFMVEYTMMLEVQKPTQRRVNSFA
jgi:hypothetical protein